jgi:hypothetical protein
MPITQSELLHAMDDEEQSLHQSALARQLQQRANGEGQPGAGA